MPNLPFLERLPPEARAELDKAMHVVTVEDGGMVISQEEDSKDVFLVISGQARATIFSDEGKTVAYRDIGPGEIFGELAAIDDGPRSASVVAAGPLQIASIKTSRFRALVESNPGFAWALLGHLSAQSRVMTERIYEFSTMLVRERLLQELVRMGESRRIDQGAVTIAPAPTHYELASRISTHREAVSREMSKLSKAGLVGRSAGNLVLPDLDGLRAMRRDAID